MEDRGSRIETSRRWPERCPVGVTDGKRVGREEQAGCPVFWRKGYATKAGGDRCQRDLNRRCVSAKRLDTPYGLFMARHDLIFLSPLQVFIPPFKKTAGK